VSPRAGWALAALLALGCAAEGALLLRRGPGFATLPIFVPTSLDHERAMRAARGQPAGRGGEEAVRAAEDVLSAPDAGADPARAATLARLRASRAALLEARNARHALNIALMDVGVELARELTPAQWDAIHMRRDALRGKAEADLFERAERRLRE
jgi:hypothetical protein